MTKIKCPYVTCKFNSSNIVNTLGVCRKDEITLKAVDVHNGEECFLDCLSYWWQSDKKLTYQEE